MTELEKFITERFGDLLMPGELEMLKQPQGFERLKNTLMARVNNHQSTSTTHAIKTA